jgi:hypothetical protein
MVYLIASSSSLAGARKLVSEFFFWKKVSFVQVSKNIWSLSAGSVAMPAFRIIKKGGRYRFEQSIRVPGESALW